MLKSEITGHYVERINVYYLNIHIANDPHLQESTYLVQGQNTILNSPKLDSD
jgi:hypothetical protein